MHVMRLWLMVRGWAGAGSMSRRMSITTSNRPELRGIAMKH